MSKKYKCISQSKKAVKMTNDLRYALVKQAAAQIRDVVQQHPASNAGAEILQGGIESIEINGAKRSVMAHDGMPVDPTVEGIEEFWQWFGASHATDDRARPLLLRDFTTSDFSNLDEFWAINKYGRDLDGTDKIGAWVKPIETEVSHLVDMFDHGRLLFASINNPLVIDGSTEGHAFDQINKLVRSSGGAAKLREALRSQGHDSIVLKVRSGADAGVHAIIPLDSSQLRRAARNSGIIESSPDFMLNQPGFHGTAYQGIRGFDTEKIGSGVGSAAYGWGLYFSTSKEVAERYRKILTEGALSIDGTPFIPGNITITQMVEKLGKSDDNLVRWLGQYIQWNAGNQNADTEGAKQVLDAVRRGSLDGGAIGQVYEVEIPEDDFLLHWDVKLSEQPAPVKAALERAGVVNFQENMGPSPTGEIRSLGVFKQVGDLHGENIYRRLTQRYFSSAKAVTSAARKEAEKQASLFLAEIGIKGIRYAEKRCATKSGEHDCFVVFSGDDVAIKNQLYPEVAPAQQSTPRGSIGISGGREFSIDLLPGADASTFLHEASHLYLEVLVDLASAKNASEEIKEDLREVLDFLGMDSADQLSLANKDKGGPEYALAEAAHEKFALANEVYLLDGAAPNEAFLPMFERFQSWLKAIYRDIKSSVNLTPGIEKVLSRIYANPNENEYSMVSEEGVSRVRRQMEARLAKTTVPAELVPDYATVFSRAIGNIATRAGFSIDAVFNLYQIRVATPPSNTDSAARVRPHRPN